MRTRKNKEKCLVSKCNSGANCRGLCGSCYNIARIMIKKGEATDAQFVSKGLLLPAKPKGFSFLREEFSGNKVRNQFFGN